MSFSENSLKIAIKKNDFSSIQDRNIALKFDCVYIDGTVAQENCYYYNNNVFIKPSDFETPKGVNLMELENPIIIGDVFENCLCFSVNPDTFENKISLIYKARDIAIIEQILHENLAIFDDYDLSIIFDDTLLLKLEDKKYFIKQKLVVILNSIKDVNTHMTLYYDKAKRIILQALENDHKYNELKL